MALAITDHPVAESSCMYCGGGPLSGEHILSQWMHPLLSPTIQPGTIHVEADRFQTPDGVDTLSRSVICRGTNARGVRVRRTCITCNSGWMNKLEGKVARPLSGLVAGSTDLIDPGGATDLARWLAQKSMILDIWRREHSHSFSREERAALMTKGDVPPGFTVYGAMLEQPHPDDGLADRARWNECYHPAIHSFVSGAGREVVLAHYVFGLHNVLLVALHNSTTWPIVGAYERSSGLGRIWPLPGPVLELKLPTITQRGAERLDRILEGLVQARVPPSRTAVRLTRPSAQKRGAQRVRPDKLPWKFGPLMRDLVCAGCPSIIFAGLSAPMLRDNWSIRGSQLILTCPTCGTDNDIPVRPNQREENLSVIGLVLTTPSR